MAWLVITPPAMLIGSYIVVAQKLDNLLDRNGVRGMTDRRWGAWLNARHPATHQPTMRRARTCFAFY